MRFLFSFYAFIQFLDHKFHHLMLMLLLRATETIYSDFLFVQLFNCILRPCAWPRFDRDFRNLNFWFYFIDDDDDLGSWIMMIIKITFILFSWRNLRVFQSTADHHALATEIVWDATTFGPVAVEKWRFFVHQQLQHELDRSSPESGVKWTAIRCFKKSNAEPVDEKVENRWELIFDEPALKLCKFRDDESLDLLSKTKSNSKPKNVSVKTNTLWSNRLIVFSESIKR